MKQFEETFYMVRIKNVTGRYIDLAGLFSKDEAERQLKKYQELIPTHEFKLTPHKIKFKK